jgi:hypothetical protein
VGTLQLPRLILRKAQILNRYFPSNHHISSPITYWINKSINVQGCSSLENLNNFSLRLFPLRNSSNCVFPGLGGGGEPSMYPASQSVSDRFLMSSTRCTIRLGIRQGRRLKLQQLRWPSPSLSSHMRRSFGRACFTGT